MKKVEFKNKNPFLITAMGRSGTKFLATMMNRSSRWTVRHEPKGRGNEQDPAGMSLFQTFNTDYYGEVNSMLRWKAAQLQLPKTAVILREPYALATSVYNKTKANKKANHKSKGLQDGWLEQSLYALDTLIGMGYPVIWFEKMTTDVDYLNHVIESFGIDDVGFNDNPKPVNANPKPEVNQWEDVPEDIRRLLEPQFLWFKEKYYGEKEPQVHAEI